MTGLEYKNNLSCKRHGADPNLEDVTDAYEDGIAEGYRRCKADMMEVAVETELYWDGDFLAIDLNMAALGYSEKDKVRVIICKKED